MFSISILSANLTQVSSSPTVLEGAPTSVSKLATKELINLHVEILYQKKVASSTQMPDHRQELILSAGENLITDMYIPTYGLVPNSSYVPGKLLNANGFVTVDENLRVKGATDVWAIGDVSDMEWSQFIFLDRQSVYVAKSVISVLNNTKLVPYKAATKRKMNDFVPRYRVALIS
jgi:NADH dehydrogenase FAD-containing subunit